MPKLSQKKAQQVDSAEEVEFDRSPLEPGRYPCVLLDVEVKEGAKAPYWAWKFEVAEGEERAGKYVFNNTSLSDKALGTGTGLKKTFAAFGVSTDTDTDDLVGRKVILDVSTRTIQKGDRKGELTNDIEALFPFEGDDAPAKKAAPAEADDSAEDGDDDFDV